MTRTLPHVTAALMALCAILVSVGWVAALAADGGTVYLPVWGDLPGVRWFVFIDRWSCGVGRVRSVDLDALGEPAASRWLKRRIVEHRALGFRSVHGQESYLRMVLGPQYHGPKYGGINADEWSLMGPTRCHSWPDSRSG